MKRKMVWAGLPWLAGLAAAAAAPTSVIWSLLPAAFLLLGVCRLLKQITTKQLFIAGISFALSVGVYCIYTAVVYQPVISRAGEPDTFSGRVVAVQEYDNSLAQIQLSGTFYDGRRAKIMVFGEYSGMRLGDDMQVCGTFSLPEDSYLSGGSAYYRSQSIFLEADQDAAVICIPVERWEWVRALQAYRSRISLRIQALAGTDAGGLVSAMLLGTKNTLTDPVNDAFTKSGIRHVASVSGLHIVLILSVWTWICSWLRLGRRGRFFGALLLVLLYAIMVNAPVSILRAGLMFLLTESAPLFFRRSDTLTSICFAGIVLTLWNPYLIQNASFLLSMTGTFGISVAAPCLTRHMPGRYLHQRILKKLAVLACTSACTFPVMILFFREVSVASPLSNLILVPICSLMVLLGMVIFLTGGVGFAAKPICLLLQMLYKLIMLLEKGLMQIIPATYPTGWTGLPVLTTVLVVLVLVLYVIIRKPRTTALSIAAAFVILTAVQAVCRVGQQSGLTVTIMGQKDAVTVVVQCQGRTDVIDLSGSRHSVSYVEAFFAENGLRQLDALCLTRRADQLRVTYAEALADVAIGKMAVPVNCVIPAYVQLPCNTLIRGDNIVIEDALYQAQVTAETVQILYGSLHFCIGGAMVEVPAGEWDAVICSSWHGDPSAIPETACFKEEVTQLRVTDRGEIRIHNLN